MNRLLLAFVLLVCSFFFMVTKQSQQLRRMIPSSVLNAFDDINGGSWSVLQPTDEVRRNFARNPSAEVSGTDQWTTGGVFPGFTDFPVKTSVRALFGSSSFRHDQANFPSSPDYQSGFFFTPTELGHHVVSIYVKKTGELDTFEINVDGNVANVQYTAARSYDHNDATEADWFRWVYEFDATALTPMKVRFRTTRYSLSDTYVAYLDGVLVEHASGALPYFDGTFTGASWEGTPHASSSIFNGLYMPLINLGFTMTSLVGGNNVAWNTISTPFAYGGAYYQGSTPGVTDFSIVGTIESDGTRLDLERKRRKLARIFSPRAGLPVTLIYNPKAWNSTTYSEPLAVDVVYTGGLEGNLDNETQETVSINVRVHTPFLARRLLRDSQVMTINKTVDSTSGVLKRDPDGNWKGMPLLAGFPYITAWTRSPSGVLFAAVINGTLNTSHVISYDEQNGIVNDLGTFTGGTVPVINSLKFGPDGLLWAAGQYTTINGIGTRLGLCYLQASGAWQTVVFSWSTPYAGTQPFFTDMAWIENGDMFATGNFGVLNGTNVKNWVRIRAGTMMQIINATTGPRGLSGDTVPPRTKVLTDDRNWLYMYGLFEGINTAPGSDKNFWALQINPVYSVVSLGDFNGEVFDSEWLDDGHLFAVGPFTTINTFTATGYATTTLPTWKNFPYLTGYGPVALSAYFLQGQVSQAPDGLIHTIYPSATPTNDVFAGGWLQFSDSGLVRPEYRPVFDIYNPTVYPSAEFRAVEAFDDGSVVMYGIRAGTSATVPNTNVILNEGDSNAWPEIYLQGPMTLYTITNYTTHKKITFDLTLLAGDSATLTLFPLVRLTSRRGSDRTITINAGSQTNDFFLVPGQNSINIGASDLTIDSKAIITWQETFDSVSAAFNN